MACKTREEADLETAGETPPTVRLLDLVTVMAALDLSESSVKRRVKDGILPAPVKIADANRWVESELAEAIKRLPRAAWAAKATGRRMHKQAA